MKAQIKPRIMLDGRTALETVIPLATPFVVFVDPASACNFQCSFCPTGHRDMIRDTGRYQGAMKFDVFTKIIDDLAAFEKPIKVLRLYKDGEPFLNKRLADMIAYAKASGRVDYVDTTTNGTFLSPETLGPVLAAGLDKINISVDGMNSEQYKQFTGYDFDFERFVENVKWLYKNKGQCEVFVKIPAELISEPQKQEFYDTFGDHCDRIFIENFAPCWPEFDVEAHTQITIKEGIYQQAVSATNTCPYIFYGYSVNADGLVSSCFLDWGRKLIIGDVRKQSMKEIWNSDAMNALRLQHLQGKRCQNGVCHSCGQLSHCLPDNIDAHVPALLEKFTDMVAINPAVKAPGGMAKPALGRRRMIVLHIAPHLGGGVGKAHAALAEAALNLPTPSQVRHVYALLEEPRDVVYADRIRNAGCELHIAPELDRLAELAAAADIVQIEWWNHPRLYSLLVTNYLPAMRLTTWVHVSGLAAPLIPRAFVELADQTLFTSSRSFEALNLRPAILERPDAFGMVNSGFGLSGIRRPLRPKDAPLRFGYLGTLDFIKMHPHFFDFVDAVEADIRIHLWGQCAPDGEVAKAAAAMRHPERIHFEGYTTDPASILSALDVFVYLLAPNHYGTAENALVEAMSAGAVPIVFDNAAETCIVADRKNGFVVRSAEDFIAIMADLIRDPAQLVHVRMSARADMVRYYSPQLSIVAFDSAYAQVMQHPKQTRDFAAALGLNAMTWFLSSLSESGDAATASSRLFANGTSKGSLGHFQSCLPQDESLRALSR